jgi:hypothetical protein
MTSITWTAAASHVLGRSGADVCDGGGVPTAPAAPIQGTAVLLAACPAGAMATGLRGTTAGTGSFRVAPARDRRPKSARIVERFLAPTYRLQHDGTTLGIRSPGRSLS